MHVVQRLPELATPIRETVYVACSAALELGADGKPPSEFRIFKAGLNETSKGPFLCDAVGLSAVLDQFQREGVDLMIDLEHDSLDEEKRAQRSDAGDARGWCKLAARNGELWAVNVTWTPDGAERLTSKKQRYISPVAGREKETNRLVSIFNLALCAVPATYGAAPLVAASKTDKTPTGGLIRETCHAVLVALAQKRKNRIRC
jgi:phage I-like protein